MEELKVIMEKFAALEGRTDRDALVAAIRQADRECGSCGCELDPLYKKALALLGA